MEAFVVDAFDFSRQKQERSGETAVAEMARLSAELIDSSGTLKWAVQGGTEVQGHPGLTLEVAGRVHLRCQRCLGPLEFDVDSHSVLVLANDEAGADALEEQLDDESIDVIAGSRTMDMAVMIEDEALLALPLSPRHDVCPDSSAIEGLKQDKPDSPFAVLKNLKK
ncbi:YceD family protein [Noviherbaspirillum suwonense]|jgi:uncharacterized protein|uniref:Large ribosomal RNA subunit accumulation protein YceD n=1 Tax=Noviherbaspirillum suwonense TaxID=1224511 RepID=A0ABY1QHG8_9BURK|nr:YceD family protein [Noviherbaspirillum suwonense]SMP69733.1 uncharacterized protein SAMN06295970_11585 [Noviherbaspirillum suwonense]